MRIVRPLSFAHGKIAMNFEWSDATFSITWRCFVAGSSIHSPSLRIDGRIFSGGAMS